MQGGGGGGGGDCLSKIVLNKSTDTVRRVRLTLRGRVDGVGGGRNVGCR